MKLKLYTPNKVNVWQYHMWFAWHPIMIGGTIYWLERVSRCRGAVNNLVGDVIGEKWYYRVPA